MICLDPVIADLLKAVTLGIVEGVTEFLPISSTGHLILAGAALSFEGQRAALFNVFIQLGAVLAVIWLFRADLLARARRLPRSRTEQRFAAGLLVAFLPAAVVGLLLANWIEAHLFAPLPVALAQIVGAILILAAERRTRLSHVLDLDQIRMPEALTTGLAQVLSLWPGMSRAGATIVGGMLGGMDRPTATRFSFYLAIPTLGAASLYSLAKHIRHVTAYDAVLLAVGFGVTFVVSIAVIRGLLQFVSRYTLTVFAWYRLLLGGLVLLALALGWL